MKIATCNLRSGGRGSEHWRHIVDEFAPDILLMQEAADPAEFIAADPGTDYAWAAAASGAKTLKWGSAIFVRGVVREALTLQGFEGWVVGADVEVPATMADTTLRAFSLHAPTRSGTSYVDLVHTALDAMRPFAD